MSPPPESHEKRQRDRRKQQKRKEKRERKQQRKDEKRNTRAYYVLRRGDEQHGVDSDLWLSALDLALVGGWTPPAPESEGSPQDAFTAILRPAGLELPAEQSLVLGRSIETMLPAIAEDEQPLTNRRFGEEYTQDLLVRRVAGEKLALDDAGAALELLSGQPRHEVELLANFLKAGAVSFEVAL